MPVFKYDDIRLKQIDMDSVNNVSRAAVIGKPEGWEDNVLRVFRIGPNGYTPRHQHDWEHVNYIIRGRGKLRIGDTVYDIAEKDFAFVPPNTEHQFENPYNEPFEFICIVPARGEY
jgi:quercetin dioxygenase-like cupin family protein